MFDATNGERYKEETVNIQDNQDYLTVQSRMSNLLNNNELELNNGVLVKSKMINDSYSIKLSVDPSNSNKWDPVFGNNKVKIPHGNYYLVCLIGRTNSEGQFQGKYSGKYITVKKNMAIEEKA